MSKKYYQADNVVIYDYNFDETGLKFLESVHIKDFFDKWGVPEEYQRVYFYKSKIVKGIREFFTGTIFNYEKFAKNDIYGVGKKVNVNENVDLQVYNVDINDPAQNKEEVMEFFNRLEYCGLLKNYIVALKEAFSVKKEINYVIDDKNNIKPYKKSRTK